MKTKIMCSICGKNANPSDDHIPPRTCGNNKKILEEQYYPQFGIDGTCKIEHKISQNGLYLSNICSHCNSDLGSKADIELGKLVSQINKSDSNNNNIPINEINLKLIHKAVCGHILASAPYSNSLIDKEMRKFVYENEQPNLLHVFLFFYPYSNIFISKLSLPIRYPIRPQAVLFPECIGISCLYFSPLAFIVTESNTYYSGFNLTNLLNKKEQNFILKRDGWINNCTKKTLPLSWPCLIKSKPGEQEEDDSVDAVLDCAKGKSAYLSSGFKNR